MDYTIFFLVALAIPGAVIALATLLALLYAVLHRIITGDWPTSNGV